MKYDGTIQIAVGASAESKSWKNQKIKWSTMVDRLTAINKTNETFKEFLAMSKEDQCRTKDVGGYVGGYLRGGSRSLNNVVHRQLATLDIDFAHIHFWSDFLLAYENAAVLHATHKHCTASPRLRLIMPLSRECTPDEYQAVCRRIAGTLGIDMFDSTTFEPNRLMFWPSVPKDVDFYYEKQDGPWIDVDAVLDSYPNWTDTSLWPTANVAAEKIRHAAARQQDPTDKDNIIGAFCRTYTISAAITAFLSDHYEATSESDRYTYKKGSTSKGLVVYDDTFAYSHHSTDPCGGKLCNAFDLVRIQLFGHLDNPDALRPSKSNSFTAMQKLVLEDRLVKKVVASEKIESAKYDFVNPVEDKEDTTWMQDLEIDSRRKYVSTASNIDLILANDPRLRGVFRYNKFDGKRYVFLSPPWRRIERPEPMRNVDISGLRNYIENIYGIVSASKIDDSISVEFEKNSFHPVQDYLNRLKWDGEKRIDTLLIDYFGVEDTHYTREAIRKCLVGAVARVMRPGVKFDLVLTLISTMQGTGKSSFLKALGGAWFSDSFSTVVGKESFEQLQGAWIIELAELSGIKKVDIESVKHFISKQEDTFRPAYGHTTETYKRQCVFIATTNESRFFRDPTGSRRFLPIVVKNTKLLDNRKLIELIESQKLIDQIWAEALHLYSEGEKLYLSDDAEHLASAKQSLHSETDERTGIIDNYLNRLLPVDWDKRDLHERRAFIASNEVPEKCVKRETVCIAEIWCECLGKEKEEMTRYNTRDLNDIMRGLPGWEVANSTKNYKIYGTQKFYTR